jgi:predicted ATP-dependent endonuclease of OLD family
LFKTRISEAEKEISKLVTAQIVYLPTYRRIEKELQSIFPQIDEELRKYTSEREYTVTGRRGNDFVELVSFGMQDIKKDVDLRLGKLRDFARDQFNSLTGSYLTDVIHAQADRYNKEDITRLTDADISEVLKFVDEKSLSSLDKEMLKKQITDIAKSKKLTTPQKYMANFFVKLLNSRRQIRSEDAGIRRFAELCNEYLQPSKFAVYDDTTFHFSIFDDDQREIEMPFLSSGEKQIISIFSHLLLSQSKEFIVVIDEPELSLSVPWQVRFLPDILATSRCCALLSVTHSPFIFDNALRVHTVDLREAISKG